ncbi:MAG TPA: hypothetical protein VFN91_03985, partial [Myxococcaceae bacterium]|nr:hypothetical protein [Myxococcaceae bacterium]
MTDPDAPHPRRRLWVWVSALVLLLVAGGVTWRVLRRPPPLQYQTAAVTKGPVVAKVTATGILSAVVTVQVGLGDEVARAERLVAVVGPLSREDVRLRLLQLAFRLEDVGLRLIEVGLEER